MIARHDIKNIFTDRPTKDKEEDLYRTKYARKKDDMKDIKKLLKALMQNNNASGGGHSGFGSRSAVNWGKNQRVTFKASNHFGMNVHNDYLRTYMVQENKKEVTEKPVLFGTEPAEYEENKVGLHHKFMLSPENPNMNMQVFTKEFIKHIETLTGFKLYWQAAIHTDTSHPHVHICINGKDKNGKDVFFQPELIKRTFRETASYIATQMLGERTPQEIANAHKNTITQKRWTKLDESITGKKEIKINDVPMDVWNRAEFLCSIGLADKDGNKFLMHEDWENVLTITGRYNQFMEKYILFNGNLELYRGRGVSGKVIDTINFDKDESWNDALIIRTEDGKNIFVPMWKMNRRDWKNQFVSIADSGKEEFRQVYERLIKPTKTENKKQKYIQTDNKHKRIDIDERR